MLSRALAFYSTEVKAHLLRVFDVSLFHRLTRTLHFNPPYVATRHSVILRHLFVAAVFPWEHTPA
jgi:hypothetical protein